MAGAAGDKTKEESDSDAGLFSNLRHFGHRHRCHHCVDGTALLVPTR